ncbi:hypothetical protein QL093DRAFT_2120426 [Fusarium oxysporum]|nr:hypothetical protein QL093DRAFT_2120426 [Fusarium oxysporum]
MIVEGSLLHWGMGQEVEERTSRQLKIAADSTEDMLFRPFLMQGRPMLLKGKELEEAGFTVL